MTVQNYKNIAAEANTDHLQTALSYHRAGLRVIPVTHEKRPACKGWKQYQTGQTEQQVKELFSNPVWGIAILTGQGVEAIDVDAKYWLHNSDLLTDYMKHNDVKNGNACPLTSLCIQSTVNGGYHIIYRCPEIEGNKKLAQRPATVEEAEKGERVKVLFETRGEGGYIVAHPSPGYELENGDLTNLPEITPDQRAGLFAAARDFDETGAEIPEPIEHPQIETGQGLTPWDDYNAKNNALDLLTSAGWQEVYTRGERVYLKRPGDTKAPYSGNYHTGKGIFVCFSSSTEFEPETGYTAYGVYTMLNHRGDFSASAKALISEGYGEGKTPRTKHIERIAIKQRKKAGKPGGPKDKEEARKATLKQLEEIDKIHGEDVAQIVDRIMALPDDKIYQSRAGSLSTPAPPLNAVLSSLLEELPEIDFRDRLGVQDDDKPKQKHCIVAIIDEIIETATRKKWGLCVENDFVYIYNGQYWQAADKNEFKHFLGQAAERVKFDPYESRYFEFRDKLYKQFLAVADLPAPDPDEHKTLINLKNGTLEITPNGANLRGFLRDDFLKYQLPFDYTPGATCPRFDKYLNEVLPGQSAQKVLAEYIGYVFTRHLKLEKCLVLYGSGANGKSVFADVMNALIGEENITNFSLGSLMEEHNRAYLQNALLNYGSEIKGKTLESDDFKLLASGEKIQARFKYGNSFLMSRYAKLAFNSNELPKDVEQTEAFFRRFMIVPFEVTIPTERRNPNLAKQIISDELHGVLNWVLQGLNRILQNEKFSRCTIIEERLSRYRSESDSVYLFIEEYGYTPAKNYTSDYQKAQKELYREYKDFCKDDGYRPLSNRNFAVRLEKLGYERDRTKKGQMFFVELEGVDRTPY